MIFYDYNGNEHEFDLSNRIGNGWCGEVYQYESELVLKKYRDLCHKRLRLKKDVYDIVKDINSPHIVEINELLFKKKREDSIFSVLGLENVAVDAYTCKYIKADAIDILNTPTEYLIHNMNELSKLFTELSRHGVRVEDLKASNTIIQEDKIVLIDFDLFHKVLMTNKRLDRLNQLDLLLLFKEIISDCVWEYEYEFDLIDSIDEVFKCSQYFGASAPIVEVSKQLQKYKYPIDYLRKYTDKKIC